jgi:hypothetical protein
MFKELGYFKEYYIYNKFIGFINCEKDRDIIGYNGRQEETTKSDIILFNKKKIKKGTLVRTIIYPLCGSQIS